MNDELIETPIEETNEPEPRKMTAAELLAAYSDPTPQKPPQLSPDQELLQACKMALNFFVQNGAQPTDLLCRKLIKLTPKAQTRRLVIVGKEAVKELRLPKYTGKAQTVETFRLLCLDYLMKAVTAVAGHVVAEIVFFEEKGEFALEVVEKRIDHHHRLIDAQPVSEGLDAPE